MFKKRMRTIVRIDGMNCKHCINKIKVSLEKIENIKKVKVNLLKKEAIIFSDKKIDNNLLKEKIENLDYKVIGILEENV